MLLLAASLLCARSRGAVLRGDFVPHKTMTAMLLHHQQHQRREEQEQDGSLASRLGLGSMETTDWAWLVIGFVGAVLGIALLAFIIYRCQQRCVSRDDNKTPSTARSTASSSRNRSRSRGCCCRRAQKGNSDDDEDDVYIADSKGNDNEQPRNDPTRSESDFSQADHTDIIPGLGRGGRGSVTVNHNNNVEDVDDNNDDTWSFSMASYSVAIGTGRENADDDNDDDRRYHINDDDTSVASWDRAAQKHFELYQDRNGRTLYNI
jgi:hypothetical protein